MTPAEKEKIIAENRLFIRQHVRQKFPKFMKSFDELCSAAEAAVWLDLDKYIPEKGSIDLKMAMVDPESDIFRVCETYPLLISSILLTSCCNSSLKSDKSS